MIYFFIILTGLYLLFVIAMTISWESIPYFFIDNNSEKKAFVSVVIAVRNEEKGIKNLLYDLSKQNYSHNFFEVIIVDDHSTDRTISLINDFSKNSSITIRCFSNDNSDNKGKKYAILKGIENSNGDLIITTDGDCRVKEGWLQSIESFYASHQCKMMVGPVALEGEENFFSKMQQVEFSSLIGSGAASLNLGFPNMCNGANLAYEKKVFYEVNGFEGNLEIPSGDDEFLMHKIYKRYPGQVSFLKNPEAIVLSSVKENFQEFSEQRKRWASKWPHYKITNIKLLAFFIFVFNLSFPVFLVLAILGWIPHVLFLEQITLKMIVEFVFLSRVTSFFNIRMGFLTFIILQFTYPFYVVYFAFSGFRKGYEWKGRKINTVLKS